MKYLSDIQLAERYGVSRSTIWRWYAAGRLPSPIQLGPNTTRWDSDDVERCDEERKEAVAG